MTAAVTQPDAIDQRRLRWKRVFHCYMATTASSWLALTPLVDSRMQPGDIARLFFVLLFFQLSMLGFWIGVGRRNDRLFIALILCSAMVISASLTDRISNLALYSSLCSCTVLIASMTTGWLRYRKGALQLLEHRSDQSTRFRFGIRSLIVWTGTIAVLLAIGRILAGQFDENYLQSIRSGEFVIVLGLSFCCAVPTFVNAWALLCSHVTFTKLLSLLLVVGSSTIGTALLMRHLPVFYATVTTGSQLLVSVAMVLLRKQGLRFAQSLSD